MNTNETPQANMKTCKIHGTEIKRLEPFFILGNISQGLEHCDECEKEKEIKLQNEKIENEKKRNFESENKGIPRKFLGARLSQFENIGIISEWINNPKGFLFIHGDCGCGKSHLASAIKYHFNLKQEQCGLAFCSDIFLQLRSTFGGNVNGREIDVIKKYAPDECDERRSSMLNLDCIYSSGTTNVPSYSAKQKPHLAIFDDIGAQKISDYVIEAWYNIIDRRYMFEHPTIFTSNLSLKEISVFMSDRIASRIASGIVFKLQGDDRRIHK